MPVNPAYQFMNADADLAAKNQFMDFLRRDAMANGMGDNYAAQLGNEQQMMNTIAANPPAQIAPAPQPIARPMPKSTPRPNVGAMKFPQVQAAQNPVPDFQAVGQPEAAPLREPADMGGLGSWNEVPMTDVSGASMGEQAPQEINMAPLREPVSSMGETAPMPKRPDLSQFEQTTLAKKAQERGFDPRQIMVALAEFSAGMGNLKGKPTASTARDFYQMQLDQEAQARKEDMQLQEMAMRFAPKRATPVDVLKQEFTKAQTDSLRNKTAVERELNDPMSERSMALKSALESYVTASTGRKGFKAKQELTGADVYKWLAPVQFSIGQAGLEQRTAQASSTAETGRQDRLDAEARRLAAAQDIARQKLEIENKRLGLDQQKAAAAQASQAAKASGKQAAIQEQGEVVQIPGWKQTNNVPFKDIDIRKLRGDIVDTDEQMRKVRRLRQLISQHGSFELPSSRAGAEMEAIVREIQLMAKNPSGYNLGVLAGPDLMLLESIIPTTSGMSGLLSSNKGAIQKLDTFIQNIDSKLNKQASILGFEREAAPQSSQPTGARGLPVWTPGGK